MKELLLIGVCLALTACMHKNTEDKPEEKQMQRWIKSGATVKPKPMWGDLEK